MSKVLIVDDEESIVNILKFRLEKMSYEVVVAYNGTQALEVAFREKLDLIILDIMIPEMNGFEVCNRLRAEMTVPIIMLTACEDITDKVLGLSIGADDYICKPFNIREVLARVESNIRRVDVYENKGQKNKTVINKEQTVNNLEFKNISINRENFEVKNNGVIIELTPREYELLEFFALNPNKTFTREDLLRKVWNYDYLGDIRTVDVTVSRLRDKIVSDNNEKHIMTKRGFGYYFI